MEEGENILPLINEFGEAQGLSDQAITSLKEFAVEIDSATSRGRELEGLLDRLQGRGELINNNQVNRVADDIIRDLENERKKNERGGGDDDKATKAIQKRVEALQLQAETLRMTTTEAKLHKLADAGATAEQLKAARAALEAKDAYEAEQKALEASVESRRIANEIIAEIEADRKSQIEDGEQLLDRYMTDEDLLREHHERRLEILEDARAADFENQAKWDKAIQDENDKYRDASENLDKQNWKSRFDTTQHYLGQLSGLMSSENRKMFEVGKAAAIANSIVSTYSGAAQALDDLPFPANIAAAAAVTLAGFARVQAIRSTSFDGGGGAGGAGGGGITGGVQTVPAAPAPIQLDGGRGADSGGGGSISITVQGSVVGATKDELADMFGDALRERIANKDYVLIDSNSRNGRTLR